MIQYSASVREVCGVQNSSDTYLDITVNGKIWPGLVGTGRDKSLIPCRFMPRTCRHQAVGCERDRSRERDQSPGYDVRSLTQVMKFLVTDLVDELILGDGWLAINKGQSPNTKERLASRGQNDAPLRCIHWIYITSGR